MKNLTTKNMLSIRGGDDPQEEIRVVIRPERCEIQS